MLLSCSTAALAQTDVSPPDAGSPVEVIDAGDAVSVDAGVEAPPPTDADAGTPASTGEKTVETKDPQNKTEPPKEVADTKAEHSKVSLLALLDPAVGGPTLGTGLYRYKHTQLSYATGFNTSNERGAAVMSGLFYEERSGFLSAILGMALAAGSAQATANQSGDDTPIRYSGSEADLLGANLDFRRGDDNNFRSTAELYLVAPFGEELPLVLQAGFLAGFQNGPFIIGLTGRFIVPLTRFAQGELLVRLDLGGGTSEANAGVVLNLTNRFFVRGAAIYAKHGVGYIGMAGVRL